MEGAPGLRRRPDSRPRDGHRRTACDRRLARGVPRRPRRHRVKIKDVYSVRTPDTTDYGRTDTNRQQAALPCDFRRHGSCCQSAAREPDVHSDVDRCTCEQQSQQHYADGAGSTSAATDRMPCRASAARSPQAAFHPRSRRSSWTVSRSDRPSGLCSTTVAAGTCGARPGRPLDEGYMSANNDGGNSEPIPTSGDSRSALCHGHLVDPGYDVLGGGRG